MPSRNNYKKFDACTVVIETYLLKVLSTENSLVVSFWTFFKFLGNQGKLERTETTTNFC